VKTLEEQIEPKQSLLQKIKSIFLGKINKTVMVSSDGGPKEEMTVGEADAQSKAKLTKARAEAPPGAEVTLEDKGGGSQEVVTHIQGEEKP